jgi:iron complex transport system substrate-binding protein
VRIASLVPSATETLFALGLGDDVVAVTHECDYPEAAVALPHITRSVIPEGLSAAQIDRAVRERTGRGEAIYELDADGLGELAPDLIVTQALCEVCAVSVDDVRAVARTMPRPPTVLALDPTTLDEVLKDVRTLGEAAGAEAAADDLLSRAADRIERVRTAVRGAARPRVVALEWLDPPFAGGHWVPELVAMAGGLDPLGEPGRRSRVVTWEELGAARPEIVVCMPCGYDRPRAAAEALAFGSNLAELGAATVAAVDASAYFSRPGPRLVDGLELLAHLIHPDLMEAPPPDRAAAPVGIARAESVR